MNGPVLFPVRIIADISGGIREPVRADLLSCKLLNPGKDIGIDHIMHISGNGYCGTCCDSCKIGYPPFYPFFFLLPLHPVCTHLIDQGKRHGKSKSCHKGSHQIICKLYSCVGKLCKKNSKILSSIIIIDMALGIPQIPCRKCGTSHHGFHKAIVHKFLSPIGSRTKASHIGPQKKCCKKQHFLPENKLTLSHRKTLFFLYNVLFLKEKTEKAACQYYSQTGKGRERQKLYSHQKPGKKSGCPDSQNL